MRKKDFMPMAFNFMEQRHLPDELHQRVIGQDDAVVKVSEAIMRSKAGQ